MSGIKRVYVWLVVGVYLIQGHGSFVPRCNRAVSTVYSQMLCGSRIFRDVYYYTSGAV